MDHQLASLRYNTVFSNGRSYDHPVRNSSWPIASGLTDPLLPSPDPSNRIISIQPFPSTSLSLCLFLRSLFDDFQRQTRPIFYNFRFTSFLHSTIFYDIIVRLILLDPRIRLENVLSSSSTSGRRRIDSRYFLFLDFLLVTREISNQANRNITSL